MTEANETRARVQEMADDASEQLAIGGRTVAYMVEAAFAAGLALGRLTENTGQSNGGN